MVGWFYINEQVAAPLRMLEMDEQSSTLSLELASRFVPNLAILRGETVVEYRNWPERRLVRCLGAERVGSALMIEAVEVGSADGHLDIPDPMLSDPEDWLTIDDRAFCQVTDLHTSPRPEGHCMFRVELADWRDLRIGQDAPLGSIGITLGTSPDFDGSITPLLHAARELPCTADMPRIEIIRLRERARLQIHPLATDWGDTAVLVVARLGQAVPFGRVVQREVLTT